MRDRSGSRLGLVLTLAAAGCGGDDTGPSDSVPPAVTLTAPAEFATVQGTVTVIANATDNEGVAGVRFFVDGTPIGAEDRDPPFAALWNTLDGSDGNHSLTAQARDRAGLTTMSAEVSVGVLNGPASIELTVTMSGDGIDPDGFRILVDGMLHGSLEGPGTITLGGFPAGDHHITLEGLSLWCGPVDVVHVTLATATTTPVTIPIDCSAGPGGRLLVNGRGEEFGFEVAWVPVASGLPELVFPGIGSADVSADGTRLALIANRILLISGVDLSDQTPVANLPFGASHPRWSPDGSVIVFHAGSGVNDLYRINPDGSDMRPFFEEGSTLNRAFADWSPDGRLTYVTYNDAVDGVPVGGSIWTADGDGSNAAYFIDGHSPAWSPDGTELALTRATEPGEGSPLHIVLVGADGSSERSLTDGSNDDFPIWAPDGSWLAFTRNGEAERRELWVVRAADGATRKFHGYYEQARASVWIPGD
jgi:hypothetical protein